MDTHHQTQEWNWHREFIKIYKTKKMIETIIFNLGPVVVIGALIYGYNRKRNK